MFSSYPVHSGMSTAGIWLLGHRGSLLVFMASVWCVAGSFARGWESLRKRVGLSGGNSWHPQICRSRGIADGPACRFPSQVPVTQPESDRPAGQIESILKLTMHTKFPPSKKRKLSQ